MNDDMSGIGRSKSAGETRFKAMFEQAPLGVALIDSSNGRIKMANRKFSAITGRSADELSRGDWMSITHPDDVQMDLDQMALMNAGKIPGFKMEKRYLSPEGRVIWINMTIVPLVADDVEGPHHLCMIEDIGERKQAEVYGAITREILKILNGQGDRRKIIQDIVAALKTEASFDAVGIRLQQEDDFPYAAQEGFSEEFLRTENALTGRAADGTACRGEDGALRLECTCGLVLSGKAAGAGPMFTSEGSFWTNDSRPLLDLPRNEDPRNHPRNNCIKQRYASVALVPIRSKDAIIGLIQINNRRKGSFTADTIKFVEGIASHVGEALMRKRAEDELRESEKRFLDILYASSDAILLLDKNRFVECNETAVRMIGHADRSSFLRSHPSELSPKAQPDGKNSREKAEEMIKVALANGFHRFEWTHRRANGEDFPVEVSLTPLTMHGRTMLHCVWRDLTEHKRNEEALAKMLRLESLGTLAGGIAHDFNNILTSILGNLSLLQPRMTADADSQDLLREAQDACGTAKSLSNQLLTFAKGGSPVVSTMDLRPVLTKAALFASRGTNARCVFELGDSPLAVSIDKDHISRVIQNLVMNAAQAMPQGGDITIRSEIVTLQANENPKRPSGRYIRITVEDQGAGIKPAHLSKIFDPYFSTKGVGRGLGLATCYSIMAKHGGNISVELRPGTCFSLHFPAADPAGLIPEGTPSEPARGNGRILIMDDEASVARILKRMVEHLGYEADTAADGRAALEAYRRAREKRKPYDAVILDLTVRGGMGGLETLTRLAALDPGVSAVVTSGYANDPIMAEYSAKGFRGVLTKPYRLEDVSEALRRVVGFTAG